MLMNSARFKLKCNVVFDSIICDHPYGIRACSKSGGNVPAVKSNDHLD